MSNRANEVHFPPSDVAYHLMIFSAGAPAPSAQTMTLTDSIGALLAGAPAPSAKIDDPGDPQ